MSSSVDYRRAIEVVRAIVREWDPYSLLKMGCPDDEFESEIASVAKQVPRIQSERDAGLALSRVFAAAFDRTDFTPERCDAVGAKLFAALIANGLIKE